MAILVVLGGVVVCGTVLSALLFRSTNHAGRVRQSLNVRNAVLVADAGLSHALISFPAAIFQEGASGTVYGALPTGGYQSVCITEVASGALSQVVAHLISVGVTDEGGRAGAVVSFEVYPPATEGGPPEVIPVSYHRFARSLDLADGATVRELVTGDWAIERRRGLVDRTTNDERELAVDAATHAALMTGLGDVLSPGELRDDWAAVAAAVVATRLDAP